MTLHAPTFCLGEKEISINIFKCFGRSKSSLGVNGVSYQGTNVQVNANGDVVIDGEKVTTAAIVNISVFGDVDVIQQGSGKTTVTGNAHNISTGSGDVRIEGSVSGNVQTGSGDVIVSGGIKGNVKTGSGDIMLS